MTKRARKAIIPVVGALICTGLQVAPGLLAATGLPAATGLQAATGLLGLGPSVAFAASDEERAAARSLAEQGSQAFAAKRYADAVDLFGRAEALFHSPVHLLYLARASVQLGQLVKAQEAYIKVSRETLGSESPAAFHKAVEDATDELEALKPRISYTTVKLSGAPADKPTQLFVDGTPVASVLVGVPMPLDPGTHRFEARAEGFITASSELTMGEGQSGQVELALAPDPAAQAAAAQAAAPPSADAPPVGPADGESNGDVLRYSAYGAFGVGAIGLGLGTVFLYGSMSDSDDADELFSACRGEPGGCSADEQRAIGAKDDESASGQSKAVVGYVVGGVGIAAGVVLLVLASGEDDARVATQPSITPWVGWGSAGVSGTF